jgi:hypothetical protein
VQIVISAVLGDPTALIAGVVGALMCRSWTSCNRTEPIFCYGITLHVCLVCFVLFSLVP